FVLSATVSPERERAYSERGFVMIEDPVRATHAIAAMGRIGESFAAAGCTRPPEIPPSPIALPHGNLSESAAKALLAASGIAVAPERACASAKEACDAAGALGFPVVMKILSPDIAHKTEIGGVLLDIRDAQAVDAAFGLLMERARAAAPTARLEGVLVARQLSGGIECIAGIQRDPVFGPVALFGLGGIFVEALRDVVLMRCPFSAEEAERMVRSIRGAAILQGMRNRPPADIPAVARLLSALSVFAVRAGPRLRSIDLNPVMVLDEGQGAFALDALIEVDAEGQEEAA
ncbi:MAG: acetate--CoA ligase family protein, partial [Burkholderiaceae bacterium]